MNRSQATRAPESFGPRPRRAAECFNAATTRFGCNPVSLMGAVKGSIHTPRKSTAGHAAEPCPCVARRPVPYYWCADCIRVQVGTFLPHPFIAINKET